MNVLHILIVTFCILIGLMIYMSISLYQLKKLSKNKKSSLSDPRYFELKYQHQLFISIGAIIVFLVSFFGWNSLEGIKNNLDRQMSNYDQKFIDKSNNLKELDVKQNHLNTTFGLFEQEITKQQNEVNNSIKFFKQKLENNSNELNNFFNTAKVKVDSIEFDVNGLSNIIAKNPSIYIIKKKVAGFDYNSKSNNQDTLYFKDCIPLRTKLPTFKNAPFVIPIESEKSYTGEIYNINKDYFQLSKNEFGDDRDSIFVYFMILDF